MIEGDVYTKWCKCGAPVASRDGVLAPKEAAHDLCGPCRRHDNRHTANCAAIADAMVEISRACCHEQLTGDSSRVALVRARVIEALKKQLE